VFYLLVQAGWQIKKTYFAMRIGEGFPGIVTRNFEERKFAFEFFSPIR
jgi:hypothetical protein